MALLMGRLKKYILMESSFYFLAYLSLVKDTGVNINDFLILLTRAFLYE